jgi:dephospho-CoA kinase
MLARRGAAVVDADRLAHELMQPGHPLHQRVVERFGEVTDASGTIDRRRLGALVFADAGARRTLESLVHPALREEAERRFAAWAAGASGAPIAVFDAALLVETGMWSSFDRLLVVHCSRETQLARLAARGLDRQAAEARLASQLPTAAKLAVTDLRVATDVTLAETERQVEAVWLRLAGLYRRRHGGWPSR